jgi:hypothetical protein
MRRVGGARVATSRRVRLLSYGPVSEGEGWLLNVSRGGVRLICEEPLNVGDRHVVEVGEEGEPDAFCRPARVVWVQREPDGVIAGLEFTDALQSISQPPGAPDPAHAPTPAAHDRGDGQGAPSQPPGAPPAAESAPKSKP